MKNVDQELCDALAKYIDKIVEDFEQWEGDNNNAEKRVNEFRNNIRVKEGKNYIKVISRTSVHSFIVKEDGSKFKKGDILKPASWAAPVKNSARGNILGQYQIKWTGPNYLR